jgi:hypothetical protein
MNHDELLDYYRDPGVFTGVRGFEDQVAAIPDDVGSIAKVVQGLLIHQAMGPLYETTFPPERLAQAQLHGAGAMLACAAGIDQRPVVEARSPETRVVGVCRHFATLFVAILRHKGVPARARCGFANYFQPGKHLDHWVGEYWKADQGRWILVDAQVDDVQRTLCKIAFDTLDVPRDRFLVAGDAWQLCRTGRADPMTFGVGGTENWGLVEVFGDVMQDLAALQKIELLPWGWYGLALDDSNCEREAALVDELAGLSSAADAAALDTLRSMVDADERLRVPSERVSEILDTETRDFAANVPPS